MSTYFALCLWRSRGEAGTHWGRGEGGGVTPISRHQVYVPPNRVQFFFLPLWPILYLWKKGTCIVYLSLILEQGWFFPIILDYFLSRLNEFQGKTTWCKQGINKLMYNNNNAYCLNTSFFLLPGTGSHFHNRYCLESGSQIHLFLTAAGSESQRLSGKLL